MAKPQNISTNTPANISTNQTKEWDEARVQNALLRVQELHTQLRKLRTTVPSLLAPIHAEHNSPETLFSEFRSAATEAVKNVRSFQEKMREPRTKQILEHVKDSKEQNSEGIETWLVSQHEDWLDQPALRSANDIQAGGPKVRLEDQAIGQDQPSISQVVQKFKAEHPEASIQLNEDKRTINLHLTTSKMSFTITWDSPKPQTFKATAKGTTAMVGHINRHLAKRPKEDNLPWTLAMLGTYSDIRRRTCDKCNKTSNFQKEFTAVRIGQQSTTPSGSPTITWKAYHISCTP